MDCVLEDIIYKTRKQLLKWPTDCWACYGNTFYLIKVCTLMTHFRCILKFWASITWNFAKQTQGKNKLTREGRWWWRLRTVQWPRPPLGSVEDAESFHELGRFWVVGQVDCPFCKWAFEAPLWGCLPKLDSTLSKVGSVLRCTFGRCGPENQTRSLLLVWLHFRRVERQDRHRQSVRSIFWNIFEFNIYHNYTHAVISYRKAPKRRKFGHLHVGGSKKTTSSDFYWGLDPPKPEDKAKKENSIFADKCLLICTVFGLLQNLFYSSQRKDKKFLYLQNVNSQVPAKKASARRLLIKELESLFLVTKLQRIGPYQIQSTVKILHETYKCQFFIFTNSTLKQKLQFMYPEKYNDSLIPIYLYQSFSDLNHLIFIKNLSAYFRSNYLICFECKRTFKKSTYKHLCKVRTSCFVCRRFYLSETTYIHEKLKNNFCDRFLTSETSFLCNICNCTIYSQHCFKGHKTFCNGLGYWGFKCLKDCQQFIYASKNVTSKTLRDTHSCSDEKFCKFCFKSKETNHICMLSQFRFPKFHNRLVFFTLEVEETDEMLPILALFYKEENYRGCFKKYVITEIESLTCNDDHSYSKYFPMGTKNVDFELLNIQRKTKLTKDFEARLKNIRLKNTFKNKFISFILSSHHTTYICQDMYGKLLVSLTWFLIQKVGEYPKIGDPLAMWPAWRRPRRRAREDTQPVFYDVVFVRLLCAGLLCCRHWVVVLAGYKDRHFLSFRF